MARYRAAIVGLSWIGADPFGPATHPALGTATPYSHAAAYAATSGIDVVAGCDIDPAACAAFRDGWSERWPGLRTYADYRELIAAERLDLLSVVTPDDRHTEIVLAAVAAGVRAIFCEKPLRDEPGRGRRDGRRRPRSRRRDLRQPHPALAAPYVAARQEVRDGGIGPLAQIVAHYGGPRAMLFRNHSHFLDLLCYFAESEPAWVVAELEPGFEAYGTAYRGDGGRDPATEPGVNAYVSSATASAPSSAA